MSKSLFEELSEFTDELVILLKEDWEKTKKFIREHKKYFLWLCALFIGTQITDIMTLGKSWDAYCKKNGIQNGGSINPVVPTTSSTTEDTAKTPDTKNTKKYSKLKNAVKEMDSMSKNLAKNLKSSPVFGNMNYIFYMTTSMFTLVLFLLAVVGILSLPVIIFIIITYCVVKSLVNRLAIL